MTIYSKEHGALVEFERTQENMFASETDYTKSLTERYQETVTGTDWKGNKYIAKGVVTRTNEKKQIFEISNIQKL